MGSILLIIWAASLLLLFFLAVRVIGARVMGLRLTDWPGLVACAAGILAVPSFLLDEHPTLLATIPLALAAGIWQALRTFSSWRRGETVAGYYVTVAPPERVANRWPLASIHRLVGWGCLDRSLKVPRRFRVWVAGRSARHFHFRSSVVGALWGFSGHWGAGGEDRVVERLPGVFPGPVLR